MSEECNLNNFQTHLKEFVAMAAEQSVRLRLVLAVQGVHPKLVLLQQQRVTSLTTGTRELMFPYGLRNNE